MINYFTSDINTYFLSERLINYNFFTLEMELQKKPKLLNKHNNIQDENISNEVCSFLYFFTFFLKL